MTAQLALDYDHFTHARAERDVAMTRVAEKAERVEPGFSERAYEALVAYVAQHAEFGGEDATDAIKAAGIVPHDDRAFGPIYMAAVRNGLIKRVRFVPRRRGHGSPGPLWARAAAIDGIVAPKLIARAA